MKQPVFDKAYVKDRLLVHGEDKAKSNIIPVTHPQIPRSSAHANERKKGDKSELKRHGNRPCTDREKD